MIDKTLIYATFQLFFYNNILLRRLTMAYVLSSKEKQEILQKLEELQKQFNQSTYPYYPKLALKVLDDLENGYFPGKHPCEIYAADFFEDRHCVVKDVPRSVDKISDLEFIPLETDTPGSCLHDEAVLRNANLGLVDMKVVLAQQDDLPKKLRKKKLILFAGTILTPFHNGPQYIKFLFWNEQELQWDRRTLWLEGSNQIILDYARLLPRIKQR